MIKIDWSRLSHAYGPADDVPDQIRMLRSADQKQRERARWELCGNIFHQGSRYEATAYAAPFMLELLGDPKTPELSELLELLVAIAIGYDESWLPEGFPIAEYRRHAAGGEGLLAAGRVAAMLCGPMRKESRLGTTDNHPWAVLSSAVGPWEASTTGAANSSRIAVIQSRGGSS